LLANRLGPPHKGEGEDSTVKDQPKTNGSARIENNSKNSNSESVEFGIIGRILARYNKIISSIAMINGSAICLDLKSQHTKLDAPAPKTQ
jgi:hypothetical protein